MVHPLRAIRRAPGSVPAAALLAVAGALLLVAPAAGQSSTLASQTLGRGYWHVFIAYAVVWLLVMGWTVSIGRRLADVERRLEA